MNTRNKSKSVTPKKQRKTGRPKRSTTKKNPKQTPHKSPMRSRSPRTRALPKSPISESMRQTKIQDFFKPTQDLSNSFLTVAGDSNDIEVIETKPKITRNKVPKDTEVKPVFGQQNRRTTRSSSRNSSLGNISTEDDKNNSNGVEEKMDCSPPKFGIQELSSPTKLNNLMVGLNIGDTQNNSNEFNSQDSDLIPVFKAVEVSKPLKCPKGKSKQKSYDDKETKKNLNYILKNLSRISKDIEIQSLISIDEIEKQSNEKMAELSENSEDIVKTFEEFDGFSYYKMLSQNIETLVETPKVKKNLFISNINSLNILNEKEIQDFFSFIFEILSNDINIITQTPIKNIVINHMKELESEIEISLNRLFSDFNRILSRISSNITENSDKNMWNRHINSFLTILEIMTNLVQNFRFKLEVNSDEVLLRFVISTFALGLDYRLNTPNKTSIVRDFIEALFKHLFIDETKTRFLIKKLITFCISEGKVNPILSMRLLSLFSSEKFLDLKRQFAIAVVKQFASEEMQKVDLNLNELTDILNAIEWQKLSIEQVYVILQMIAVCLEVTEDYQTYQETIFEILNTIKCKISTSVKTSSETELYIRTVLSPLETKIKLLIK